ncbi:hypothetical protein ACLKA7_006315 [Drosophila subpalustris]
MPALPVPDPDTSSEEEEFDPGYTFDINIDLIESDVITSVAEGQFYINFINASESDEETIIYIYIMLHTLI